MRLLGVCSLLPYESRTLEISFQAYTDTDFSFPITLTTSHNRHIKIPCKVRSVYSLYWYTSTNTDPWLCRLV
jgi:hypothetical protein